MDENGRDNGATDDERRATLLDERRAVDDDRLEVERDEAARVREGSTEDEALELDAHTAPTARPDAAIDTERAKRSRSDSRSSFELELTSSHAGRLPTNVDTRNTRVSLSAMFSSSVCRSVSMAASGRAVGAVLISVQYGVINPNAGFLVGLKAFTAAVLGGIGSIPCVAPCAPRA